MTGPPAGTVVSTTMCRPAAAGPAAASQSTWPSSTVTCRAAMAVVSPRTVGASGLARDRSAPAAGSAVHRRAVGQPAQLQPAGRRAIALPTASAAGGSGGSRSSRAAPRSDTSATSSGTNGRAWTCSAPTARAFPGSARRADRPCRARACPPGSSRDTRASRTMLRRRFPPFAGSPRIARARHASVSPAGGGGPSRLRARARERSWSEAQRVGRGYSGTRQACRRAAGTTRGSRGRERDAQRRSSRGATRSRRSTPPP